MFTVEGNLSQVRFNLEVVLEVVGASAKLVVQDTMAVTPSPASRVITLVQHALGNGRRGRSCL